MLRVVIAARQTVIKLGRAPLGGKTRGGGVTGGEGVGAGIMAALVFALSCFSSLLTTLRSHVRTPPLSPLDDATALSTS